MTSLTERFDGIRRDYTRTTSRSCGAPSRSNTRWPGSAPSGCGGCSTSARSSPPSARSPAIRRCSRSRPGWRRSISPAGRSRPTPTMPARCIRPVALSGLVGARGRAPHQPDLHARRPDRQAGGRRATNWFAPIVADAEAGFGGPLNAFELMKAMIEAGAAGVHFEDQLASEKKCGHLGGKALVPTQSFIRTLNAARLAADISTSDRADRAHRRPFGDADHQRFRRARHAVAVGRAHRRGLLPPQAGRRPLGGARHRAQPQLRPLCRRAVVGDLEPDLGEAREFANEMHRHHPGKLLAYNCSPSFNWRAKLDETAIANFQETCGDRLPLPVRDAGRLPCTQPRHVRTGQRLRRAAWRPIRHCSSASSRPRRKASPRCATSTRSAPAISMRWRWRSRAAGVDRGDGRLDREGAVRTEPGERSRA